MQKKGANMEIKRAKRVKTFIEAEGGELVGIGEYVYLKLQYEIETLDGERYNSVDMKGYHHYIDAKQEVEIYTDATLTI